MKVKLAYIANNSVRKATFKRRKKGLLKKTEELRILCGVDACGIIFHPYDPEPEVFPSHIEAQRIISQLRNKSELEQHRRMVSQKDFITQRVTSVNGQIVKQQKEVRHKEMTRIMFQCLNGEGFLHLNMVDLKDLNSLVGQYIIDIDRRIDFLEKNH
ncbi:hypothetical protein Vadar_021405 [Vaccinium darrowii]|uniref:Uncharacterized protein n=1 Tax=Vaccinium darrowii TaxID=229202 RepID=A0ACB7XBE3_9ERIC|nr:hypothetical protein Vadar_021405 [Vaccinium darrowii]